MIETILCIRINGISSRCDALKFLFSALEEVSRFTFAILINNSESLINLFVGFSLEPRQIPSYKLRIIGNVVGMGSFVGALHDLAGAPLSVLEAMQVVSLPESPLLVVVIWSHDSFHAIHITTLSLGPIGDDALL